jgi:multicomponent Na+:H+ antiporter subunit D
MTASFLHPSIPFLLAALLIPFIRTDKYRWLLPLPALVAVGSVLTMSNGVHGLINYLGQVLTTGRVDTLSIVFAHVFAIQAVIGFIYAMHLKDRAQHVSANLYVAGGFGCVFAGDYLTLFLFWELMSIASTMLIWLNRAPRSTTAGFRYFLFHTLGGLLLLGGMLIRYKATGSFAFEAIIPASAQWYDYLILTGFCVNAAVVPLHAWLPDAYPRATITGAVFMSAYTTKTAVYVLLRGFSGFEVLAIGGTIMAVYGVCYATIENNARRILSYHIVSQVGYMVAGIGIASQLTLNGACAHAYAHIIYKGLLFMTTGAILYATGTAKLSELGGLVRRLPWVFVLYMVAAVSISGMPLFSGFVSKTMVIAGAAEAHRTWLALGLELASIGTFLSVGLKLPYFAFYAKPDDMTRPITPIPANMYVAMGMGAALCFIIGIQPGLLYSLLPFEADYVPYTPWHVLQISILLGFTGLGFALMVPRLTPAAKQNLDFEFFYIWIGRLFLIVCHYPFALVDTWWSEIYRRVGMAGLLERAKEANHFDWHIIDGILDGSALGVRGIGRRTASTVNGKLQDYIGGAVILAFGISAVVMLFTLLR